MSLYCPCGRRYEVDVDLEYRCFTCQPRLPSGWFARVIAQAPAPAATPEGWVLVPRDQTPEMLEAGRQISMGCRRSCNVGFATAAEVYRAMLSAAPTRATTERPSEPRDGPIDPAITKATAPDGEGALKRQSSGAAASQHADPDAQHDDGKDS